MSHVKRDHLRLDLPMIWAPDTERRLIKMRLAQSVGMVGRALALSGEHAIDYLEQAPVLILLAMEGPTPRRAEGIALAAKRFAARIATSPKLNALLATYGCAGPMRRINRRWVFMMNADVIRRLAKLDPMLLADAIPVRKNDQRLWLQALRFWGDGIREPARPESFAWAARAIGRHVREHPQDVTFLTSRTMLDFLHRGPGVQITLTPQITMASILRQAEEWHERLGDETTTTRALAQILATTPDKEADYGDLPDGWLSPDDILMVTALKTPRQLHEEGKRMHNCVASYWRDVEAGRSFIYSVRHKDKSGVFHVATLEIGLEPPMKAVTSQFDIAADVTRYLVAGAAPSAFIPPAPPARGALCVQINQLAGPHNRPPPKYVVELVTLFVNDVQRKLNATYRPKQVLRGVATLRAPTESVFVENELSSRFRGKFL